MPDVDGSALPYDVHTLMRDPQARRAAESVAAARYVELRKGAYTDVHLSSLLTEGLAAEYLLLSES